MNDLYANNEIAQGYAHLLSAYKFEMPLQEKENLFNSAISLLKAAPRDTRIKLLNNQGASNTPTEELQNIAIHCRNHGIKIAI